ncbi:DegT/DnrJ/EryC1/StrS family aminotransferase [Alphaproteobacteria bacterium]|nr:DegT/DnrJ/EryC1/StrS family aminotransferase [Alphaproteobacteria bacterium]
MSEYSAPVQFIDLAAQQSKIRDKIDAAIARVLDHGQYIMGPEVKQLENELKVFTGANHALTCANGTDALTLVMMAWGIGPGDAVFVPSFTYVASAETPAQLGATPFFVDVLEDSFNINPASFAQAIEEAKGLGLRPAVVIPVDLFGQPADIDSITQIAHAANIKVLVDGAQSFGACSHGRRVGTMGDATTTSFFPAKPLGCYGDGGAVFTQDDGLAASINSIRLHGKGSEKYDNVRIGVNSRLDTIQAAILIEKLKIFPDELEARGEVAMFYEGGLGGKVKTPKVANRLTSAWAQYTLICDNRDAVQATLKGHGVPSVVYYPKALTQQDGYSSFPVVSRGVEVSERLSGQVLSLPMHPYLKKDEIDNIINIVGSVTRSGS